MLMNRDQPKPKRAEESLEPRNDLLGTSDWMKDIIWDATKVSSELFDDEEDREIPTVTQIDGHADSKTGDLFNVSNDNVYEHSREARFRIRQTFGAIEVFHSQPAKNLQMPFVSSPNNHVSRLMLILPVQNVTYQGGNSILAQTRYTVPNRSSHRPTQDQKQPIRFS
jgi:hypothetical protein